MAKYQPDDEDSKRDTSLEDDHKGEPGKPELPELLIVFVFPLRPGWGEISRISLNGTHQSEMISFLYFLNNKKILKGKFS